MTTTAVDDDATAIMQATLAQLAQGVTPDSILASARELDDVRATLKVLEQREKTLRTVLLNYLDVIEQDAVSEEGVAFFRKTHARTGVNTERLKSLFPAAFAATKTTTPVTQIRVEVQG